MRQIQPLRWAQPPSNVLPPPAYLIESYLEATLAKNNPQTAAPHKQRLAKLKEEVKKRSPQNYSKWYIDFLLGGISAIGQLVAYPFDVIRKRMQGQALLLEKK